MTHLCLLNQNSKCPSYGCSSKNLQTSLFFRLQSHSFALSLKNPVSSTQKANSLIKHFSRNPKPIKTMRKQLLILAALPLAFTSCQQDEALTDTAMNSALRSSELCAESSTRLMAGQHHVAGEMIVSNDEDFLYVTYSATGNWRIKKTHLYVGACNGIPTGGGGNPQNGRFPYTGNHNNPSVSSYTYAISLSDIPECGCVAAHAEVVRLNSGGNVVQSETAWGEGTRIGRNWSMKFDYCAEECEEEEDDELPT
jgi:hypothetical protein